ncbi:MAG: hypothetical protein IIA67_09900, partial [Planctomycetes bacterium]|nr:hypothetical protein [Planctomycetota bacterium]
AAAIALFVNQPRDDGPQDQAGGEGRLAASSEKTGLDRKKSPESNLTAIESLNRREEVTLKKVAKPQQPLALKAPTIATKSDEAEAGSAGGGQAGGPFDKRDGKTPHRLALQEVVQYDYRISRQVAQSGLIERLLAENQIVMEAKDRVAFRIDDSSKTADDLKQLSPSDGAASGAPKRFEVIYVEGPPRQVEALLSALRLQSGVSRLNASDEKADGRADRSGAKELSLDAAPIASAATKPPPEGKAKGRATKRLAKLNGALNQAGEPLQTGAETKKTKAESTPVAGRAWRDTGEARSLSERYYKSIAAEAAPRRKAAGDPSRPKGVKDKEAFAAFKRPANIAPAKTAPALVRVKLVLRVVDAPSEKPPAAAAKPGK